MVLHKADIPYYKCAEIHDFELHEGWRAKTAEAIRFCRRPHSKPNEKAQQPHD